MSAYVVLLLTHLVANLFWIGSIVAVGVLLAGGSGQAPAALTVYRKVSVGAFGLSFVSAAVLLVLNPALYFTSSHWMHAKLPLALAVIALHHVLGARAKALASGKRKDLGPVGALTGALAVCAVLAAVLAKLKPF
jgi:putative membrane protein